jgi:endonuclease/exonuclease/phosphatase family metal-dependent hydrolase
MRIKVISLNIWKSKILDNTIEFIRQEMPDILCLQEVYDSKDPAHPEKYRAFSVLQETFPEYTGNVHEVEYLQVLPEGKIPHGIAVLSKFQVSAHTADHFVRPMDEEYYDLRENFPNVSHAIQVVTLETPDGFVNVCNLHGVWDMNGDDYTPARKNMSDAILRNVKGRERVIITGDTNAKLTNKCLTDIMETYKSVVDPARTHSTFNMRRKSDPGYATAAVDVILHGPEFRVIDAGVPDVDASDHLPVVATLEF